MKAKIAISALIGANAINIKQKGSPDVFGPNGKDYTNTDAKFDLSRIGIDIQKKGSGPKCGEG